MSASTLPVERLIFGREYYWIPTSNKVNGNGHKRSREVVKVVSILLSRRLGSSALLVRKNGEMFAYNPNHGGGRLIQKKQLAKAR